MKEAVENALISTRKTAYVRNNLPAHGNLEPFIATYQEKFERRSHLRHLLRKQLHRLRSREHFGGHRKLRARRDGPQKFLLKPRGGLRSGGDFDKLQSELPEPKGRSDAIK